MDRCLTSFRRLAKRRQMSAIRRAPRSRAGHRRGSMPVPLVALPSSPSRSTSAPRVQLMKDRTVSVPSLKGQSSPSVCRNASARPEWRRGRAFSFPQAMADWRSKMPLRVSAPARSSSTAEQPIGIATSEMAFAGSSSEVIAQKLARTGVGSSSNFGLKNLTGGSS